MRGICSRIFGLFAMALLFPLACSAYSLVLRSGRRIEIPEKFSLNKTNLVYESSPGVSISLQLVTIDIPATEQANGEIAGSFLRNHSMENAEPLINPSQNPNAANKPARRTITNDDLEKFRRQRQLNEEKYDRDSKALGLPSREQLRVTEKEEEAKLRVIAANVEAERARADALRAEEDALQVRQEGLINDSANYPEYEFGLNSGYYWPYVPNVYPGYYPAFGRSVRGLRNRFDSFGSSGRFFPRRGIYLAPSLINRGVGGGRMRH